MWSLRLTNLLLRLHLTLTPPPPPAPTPTATVGLRLFNGPWWIVAIDLSMLLLKAVVAIILVWSHRNIARRKTTNLHLHPCQGEEEKKNPTYSAVGLSQWNAVSRSFKLWQHRLSVPLTGNHTMCQNFLAGRCRLIFSCVCIRLYRRNRSRLKCYLCLFDSIYCYLQDLKIYTSSQHVEHTRVKKRPPVPHSNTHTVTTVKSLTRPAMGVESLFSLLMMPGFNWLIRLWMKTLTGKEYISVLCYRYLRTNTSSECIESNSIKKAKENEDK